MENYRDAHSPSLFLFRGDLLGDTVGAGLFRPTEGELGAVVASADKVDGREDIIFLTFLLSSMYASISAFVALPQLIEWGLSSISAGLCGSWS